MVKKTLNQSKPFGPSLSKRLVLQGKPFDPRKADEISWRFPGFPLQFPLPRPAGRRRFLQQLGALACLTALNPALATPAGKGRATPQAAPCAWPGWQAFKQQFISAGGRVVDPSSARQPTYSEGQAYALFFALVAGDRPAFDLILKWTENNLADGDLTTRLPAWLWGKRDDGSWGVIDNNPASDADLWIAYALGEAGRLWQQRRYLALSSLIAARVLREETADIPGLGLTLLPGPQGFHPSPQRWRLNPSYLPLQLLAWFASRSEAPAWQALQKSSLRMILESSPKGFTPDWIIFEAGKGFLPDKDGPDKADGGYNAIRVYLWAGTLAPDAPGRQQLLDQLAPMADYVARHGYPPERIDSRTGQGNKAGPPGFSAALLPFLQASNARQPLQEQQQRLEAQPPRPDAYYEQALTLFALGWMQGRYRNDRDGSLLLPSASRGKGRCD